MFVLASTSIASLLFYFFGWSDLRSAVLWVLVPATAMLVALAVWFCRADRPLARRLAVGAAAGAVATLSYDVVRVPIAHAGIPVFKAISYFGTVILNVPRPTAGSELVGWAYHLSNGVGFGLMYFMLIRRPRWWSAVAWGLALEAIMLVTPYAEVFGYSRSWTFFAVSAGGHVAYGLALWLGARAMEGESDPNGPTLRPGRIGLLVALSLAGVALVGADFFRLHADTIPMSPPPYLGPKLRVTWNVPEPDRVGAIWLYRRFIDPEAQFYFVAPMSKVPYGKPFDIPEAEVRRSQARSTFEVLLEQTSKGTDPALRQLGGFCHASEVAPWVPMESDELRQLAADYNAKMGSCKDLSLCYETGMAWFDDAYSMLSAGAASR